MEKKFKPFDKVVVRVWAAIEWRAAFFSHKKDKAYYTTDGDRYEENNILPYEGSEHLVGTTDSPDEEVRLEKGEWIIGIGQYDIESFLNSRKYGCIGNFKGFERFGDGSYFKFEGGMTTFAIRFSDFNPNDMEETKKHILCVKNGRVIRYKG